MGSFDLQKHVQLQHPKNLEQAVNLAIEYTAICNNDFGKTMKPSLTAEDQISAVTSLRPLESNTEKDYEKSIAQILDRLLNEREKAYGSDRSNRPYHNPSAGNRSPSDLGSITLKCNALHYNYFQNHCITLRLQLQGF